MDWSVGRHKSEWAKNTECHWNKIIEQTSVIYFITSTGDWEIVENNEVADLPKCLNPLLALRKHFLNNMFKQIPLETIYTIYI